MRRYLSLFLALLILINPIITFASPSSWAAEEINRAKELNLVTNRLLGDFQRDITREEFCEMIIKLYESLSGKRAEALSRSPFIDTNNSEVLKAYNLGIVDGVGGGRFAPQDTITREQIAVMYYRTISAIDSKLVNSNKKLNFADGDQISGWAREAVAYMSNMGIINGIGQNRFGPKGTATREQAIALTVRTYDVFSDRVKANLPAKEPDARRKLDAVEIGKLADSVVLIYVETINGSSNIGSGFFYDRGKIVTNYHVIEGAKNIVIEYDDGSFYKGGITITGYSKEDDLATLAIDDKNTKALTLGDSDNIKKGEKIYAIGSPMGLKNTLTDGIVSAIRDGVIQINAAVNPGNSGGALFNEYGEVIGIIYAKYKDSENINFAIPINSFKKLNKNRNLSLEEFIAETIRPSKPTKFTAKELQAYIEAYESSLYVNGININFNSVSVDEGPNELFIYLYLDWQAGSNFFKAEELGLKNIANTLRNRSIIYSSLTGKDVTLILVLSDISYTYPEAFSKNYIFNQTIDYVSGFGYIVFFPLIMVDSYSNYFSTWYTSYRY